MKVISLLHLSLRWFQLQTCGLIQGSSEVPMGSADFIYFHFGSEFPCDWVLLESLGPGLVPAQVKSS